MLLQPVFNYQSPIQKRTTSLAGLALLSYVLILLLAIPANSFAQCSLSCRGSLNTSLDQNGEALISPQMLLVDPDCDPIDFTVDVELNGISQGNLLDCSHVGYVLTATATQTADGNSCSTTLYISDYSAPQITCADTIISCVQDHSPVTAGYPNATDNCSVFGNDDYNYSDNFTDLPCFTVVGMDTITAQIERTWWLTDESGWADTCVQMIYITQPKISDIVFPINFNGVSAAALDCSQDPNDLNITGYPTIDGQEILIGGLCDVTVTHNDVVVGLCGTGGYNILRNWTAVNWCSGNSLVHSQIIKVMDITAPVISCPADIIVGTSSIQCEATVSLPTPVVIDDCSAFITTASWAFGTGYGPFTGIPLGTHIVTYVSTDDCGNSSTCTIQITVEDDVPPVNICKSSLNVNISSGGTAAVPAGVFDDGSFDNCGIDYFEVKRDTDPYGSFVVFACADIGASAVAVSFRAFDQVGNYNDCVIFVSVHDNIYPEITCPADVYLECDQDYLDTLVTGVPTVSDNCGVASLTYSDNENIDPTCHTGTVLRTWFVTDLSGNSLSCTQTIFVEDNTPVTVTFPADYTTNVCGGDVSSVVAGEPQLTNDNCESIGLTSNDIVFNNDGSGCYTILRDWIVIDWCTYVSNSGSTAGYFTHTQVITVTDEEAPVMTCPSSFTAASLNPICGGTYVTIDSVTATDCVVNVVITNNSIYADAAGADASGNYPLGVHVITFTANDNCGNTTTCSMTLTVEDGLAPTAICESGLVVSLDGNSNAFVTAEMVNYGSYDNCTITNNLSLSISPAVFDCDAIGLQNVVLTVIDEKGNSATCNSTIDVQDNLGICSMTAYEISGQILTHLGAPMTNVDVQIITSDTMVIDTDSNGEYLFDNALENYSYLVKPVRDTNYVNGVSSFDLILIRKHILGIQDLGSPYKMIAADVNRSGSITTFDMLLLKKIILQIDSVFSNNNSWRFVDANYVFPNEENPFQYTFPESKFVEGITANESSVDFIGVKIGDINGNANANGFIDEGGEKSERDDLIFEFENQSFSEGDEIVVPFEAKTPEDLLAFQYTIGFDQDQLELIEVIGGDELMESTMTENDFGFNFANQGSLTTAWLNLNEDKLEETTRFFELKFRAKEEGQLKNSLSINSKYTNAEAFSGTGIIKEWNVLARFEEFVEPTKKTQNKLLQNYPNPFKTYTRLSFELEEATDLSVLIYDAKGRQIQAISGFYDKGLHSVELNRSTIKSTGVYYYNLVIPREAIQSRKMIVVD